MHTGPYTHDFFYAIGQIKLFPGIYSSDIFDVSIL